VRALCAAVRALRGSWALAVLVKGLEGVVLTRHGSPLLVGEASGMRMAASDQVGLASRVTEAREVPEGQVVVLGRRTRWFDADGRPSRPSRRWRLTARTEATDLGDAADFTAKEIDEQPAVVGRLVDAVTGRLDRGVLLRDFGIPVRDRVRLVACGSSAYAAEVVAHTLATVGGIPARVVTASEPAVSVPEPGTLTVALSQSGETADVLAALERWSDPVLALTNSPQSSLARRADAVLDLGCGPEIGVAATKTFTSQVVAGVAVALGMASALGRIGIEETAEFEHVLSLLPKRMATTNAQLAGPAAALAADLAGHPGFVYVARGAACPTPGKAR
jgi:glucosamine--fructose-6-phosphate aminotransferase (isomerizing)